MGERPSVGGPGCGPACFRVVGRRSVPCRSSPSRLTRVSRAPWPRIHCRLVGPSIARRPCRRFGGLPSLCRLPSVGVGASTVADSPALGGSPRVGRFSPRLRAPAACRSPPSGTSAGAAHRGTAAASTLAPCRLQRTRARTAKDRLEFGHTRPEIGPEPANCGQRWAELDQRWPM